MVKYELYKKLGKGSFSRVFSGKDTVLSRNIAVKIIKYKNIDKTKLLNEIDALSVDHDYLLNYYEYYIHNSTIWIVTELCSGSLFSIINNKAQRESLTVTQIHQIFSQLLSGINYFHQRGWIHCDLKPSNILISETGSIKIADFGEARRLKKPIYGSLKLNNPIGTNEYQAPEARSPPFIITICIDYYSIAASIYHLITGRFITKNKKLLNFAEKKKSRTELPEKFCVFDDVIDLFLDVDIQKRIHGFRLFENQIGYIDGDPFESRNINLDRETKLIDIEKYCPSTNANIPYNFLSV